MLLFDSIPININPMKISSISERAGYWRKANQIHNWFVTNCQDGIDDCREATVEISQMKELLKLCQEVMEKKDDKFSEENLPTVPGFFFGDTSYDEYYYKDIEDTIQILTEALENVTEDNYDVEFVYHSSW
jgi:hypothetical protein